MNVRKELDLLDTVKNGLLAGFVSLSLSAIGMVQLFGERYLLSDILTMAQVLIFAPAAAFTFLALRLSRGNQKWVSFLRAGIIGTINGLVLVGFVWAAQTFDLRDVLSNVSPTLISLLTFDLDLVIGSVTLVLSLVGVSLFVVLLSYLPEIYTRAFLYAGASTLLVGLLSAILAERIRIFFGPQAARLIFSSKALQPVPGLLIFIAAMAFFYYRQKTSAARKTKPKSEMPSKNKWLKQIPLSILLLFLPFLLGTYLTEVANNVGIYLLMGLGLNIVVGLAGLLDLGYVAFFAIGAYTMAVLTSTGNLGIAQMSFWLALPICVAIAAFAGIVLGIPVLRMRGDYLAIVTLGFGEIIRILALSDMLKPAIGGAQGVLQIPKPAIGSLNLIAPEQLYYVVLAGALLAAFMSNRLRESRTGRAWIAMREDEDVAEAMGVNLVKSKLLAFAIGAGFSGLAGAIFASKLTSIFPHSFNLLISINVLSLIIVGGLGSIPGAVVGAIALVGLPELLREFAEFRYLIYGVLLVVMMLTRPEGFIPSDIIRRELHSAEKENVQSNL